MEKYKKMFLKKYKRILAIVLIPVLLLAILNIPLNPKAATGHLVSDVEVDDVFCAYEEILPNNLTAVFLDYKEQGNGSSLRFDSSSYYGYTVSGGIAYYDFREGFTFPLFPPSVDSGSYVYAVYDIEVQSPILDDDTSQNYTPYEIHINAFPGFRVAFLDGSDTEINTDTCYVYENGGTKTFGPIDALTPSVSSDPVLGEVIGWSTNKNFTDNTNSPDDFYVEIPVGTGFYFPDEPFDEAMNNISSGTLKLYPVYKYNKTTLSVTADDCKVGETPAIHLETNKNGDERVNNYDVVYQKKVTDVEWATISGDPTEPGDYKAVVSISPETSNVEYYFSDSGVLKLKSKPYSGASAEATFSIRPVASVFSAPDAATLTYDGTAQDLLESYGEANGGDMVYSLSEDGTYTDTIPQRTNAGGYTVWYKARGTGEYYDSDPESLVVAIAQKEVGLEWSDTTFTYDGEVHCPTATATGICDGDTCTVTVTGGKTDVGTYTATATALSNSNYALPSTFTKEFVINEQPMAKIVEKPVVQNLTYNGGAQKLVAPGKAEGGDIVYSLTEDGEYSSEIPTVKNAGEYTVWYKAKGSSGYRDSSTQNVIVSIAAKSVELEWSDTEFTYDKKEHCPKASITGVFDGDSCEVSVTGAQTGAGTYTVKATGLSNSNYSLSGDNTVKMTILSKEVGLEWSDTEFSYDGKEHCPKATATGVLDGDSCSVTVTGGQTKVGTYTATATALSNSNYKLPGNTTKEFSILKKELVITKSPKGQNLTYNGKNQNLLIPGEVEGGTFVYSLSKDGKYSSDIPTAKAVGEYTIWYKAEGAEGYNSTDPVSAKTVIEQKTVGLNWSDTEFMYDGEEHCPKATATGICDGDTCTVTVTGGQKKIGTYTATATALSNESYKLPSNASTEFTILDPEKLIGSVSVSMKGYIYGGKVSSPSITSKTNDVSKAKIVYKAAGSPDSAYSPSAPSEVGNYTVKVTLPENEKYNACSATAGFSVSYLPVPENSYLISGTTGDDGWYKSDVKITPTAGYELSYGDRNHFSGNPIKLDGNITVVNFYIRNAVTGEQTDVISLNNMKIDSEAPTVVDMEDNGLYYANESGNVKVTVKDSNISKVLVEGKEAELTNEGNGKMSFTLKAGKRKQKTSFSIFDKAGNKTDFSIIVAPLWAKTGELIEGDLYLESGEKYKLPSGSFWSVSGEKTKYNGGISFYVIKEGDYTLQKN